MPKEIANLKGSAPTSASPGVWFLQDQYYMSKNNRWATSDFSPQFANTTSFTTSLVVDSLSTSNGLCVSFISNFNSKDYYLITWLDTLAARTGSTYIKYAIYSVSFDGTILPEVSQTILHTASGYTNNSLKDLSMDSAPANDTTATAGVSVASYGSGNCGYRCGFAYHYSTFSKVTFNSSFTSATIGTTNTTFFLNTGASAPLCDNNCGGPLSNTAMISTITSKYPNSQTEYVAGFGIDGSTARTYELFGTGNTFSSTLFDSVSGNAIRYSSSYEYNADANTLMNASSSEFVQLSSSGSSVVSTTSNTFGNSALPAAAISYIGGGYYGVCLTNGDLKVISANGSLIYTEPFSSSTSLSYIDIKSIPIGNTYYSIITFSNGSNIHKCSTMSFINGVFKTKTMDIDLYTNGLFTGNSIYSAGAISYNLTSALTASWDASSSRIRLSSIK